MKKTYILILMLFMVLPANHATADLDSTSGIELNNLIHLQDNAQFGNFATLPAQPDINQDVQLSLDITDPDGIRNATLFYKYDNYNITYNNVSMVGSPDIVSDSYISSGLATLEDNALDNKWQYGNYTIDSHHISNMSISIDSDTLNRIVYYKITIFNITSGNWETIVEDGEHKGDQSVYDLVLNNYVLDDMVGGINIYAESSNTSEVVNPTRPDLIFEYVDQEAPATFTATVPAINNATYVSYYVQNYDYFGVSSSSDIQSFVFDTKPVVSIIELEALISGTQETFLLNVSVTDANGYETIGEVEVFYREQGTENWLSHEMEFVNNASLTESIYYADVPVPDLSTENNLDIMVNATDIVSDKDGYTGSIVDTTYFDSRGPQITDVTFYGIDAGNKTGSWNETGFEVEFTDISGIKNASILYNYAFTGSYNRIYMQNFSDLSIATTISSFNSSVPPADQNTLVFYYFETIDFLNNTYTSNIGFYYADGIGPSVLDEMEYKPVVESDSGNIIAFNATDPSLVDISASSLYYSQDGANWIDTPISTVDYGPENVTYNQKFMYASAPRYINNDGVTNCTININSNQDFQLAILEIEIDHQSSSDLQIWVQIEGYNAFLIHDRAPDSDLVTVDLMKYYERYQIGANRLIVSIIDITDQYEGILESISVELIKYDAPYPFEFIATIPAMNADTEVQFYMQLVDGLNNTANSMIYTYHSDGLAPEVTGLESKSLELGENDIILISANVTDQGGLKRVEINYKLGSSENWTVEEMHYDSNSTKYTFDYLPQTTSGNLSYYVCANDFLDRQNCSETYWIVFSREITEELTVEILPYPSLIDLENTDEIAIYANITSANDISSVSLKYRFSETSGWSEVTMRLLENTTYEGIIPLSEREGTVFFKIIVEQDEEFESEIFSLDYINAGPDYFTYGLYGGGALLALLSVFGLIMFIKRRISSPSPVGKYPR